MAEKGIHTLAEILGQTVAWKAIGEEVSDKAARFADVLDKGAFREVIFTGCGSTYYASLTAAPIFQELTGLRSRGLPSSELFLFPSSSLIREGPTLLVAISRSGQTTETLRAVGSFKQNWGKDVIVITCHEDSPLSAVGSLSLIAREAEEKSIAQTRSFTSMLVAAQALAGIAAGRTDYLDQLRALPPLGAKLIASEQALAKRLGEDRRITKFFFLGSGPNYGLACEAMLKMKEMSLSHSEAFRFMEFRHGPKSMVDEATLVIGLVSDSACEHEVAVLREVKELGARIFILAEEEEPAGWGDSDYSVCFRSGLSDLAQAVLYLPVLQLLAYYRAIAKGLNPDKPKNLEYVVKL